MIHNLRRSKGGIEGLETTQSGPMHPFNILDSPFLGDISVHPMPPDTGFGFVGRSQEALFQLDSGLCGDLFAFLSTSGQTKHSR